jgi:hypothetical protein
MNLFRQFQAVPHEFVTRGVDFGHRIVAHYEEGGSPASRARSGNRGTERNPARQAQGKIGECAVALYFGMDPNVAVKWVVDNPDGGSDILLSIGFRIDVKTTFPPFKLIWSNTLNDIYHQIKFDLIVSVSIDPDDAHQCWLEGYLSKEEFFEQKLNASPETSPLEPGTWYIDKAELRPIHHLLSLPAISEAELETMVDLDIEAELHAASGWLARNKYFESLSRQNQERFGDLKAALDMRDFGLTEAAE